jgi:RecA/RadA recombinase
VGGDGVPLKTALFHPFPHTHTHTDTEGSLVPERAAEIAASVASHLARVAARAGGSTPQGAARRADAAALTPSRLMGGVTVLRARDAAEQVAAVSSLTGLVDAAAVGGGPPIKLVVLDSVAFLVRAGVVGGSAGGDATSGRAAALSATAAALTALARSRGVAVVLTNQVTTRVTGGEGASSPSSPSSSRLVPALGAAWAHVPATRVLLHWGRGGKRLATLVKSPSLPGGSAEYRVGLEGVRGVAVVAAAAAAAVAGGGGKRGREDG